MNLEKIYHLYEQDLVIWLMVVGAICFFSLCLFLSVSIFWLRIGKILTTKRTNRFKNDFINWVNYFLFEDHKVEPDTQTIKNQLNSTWKKTAAINVLMDFKEYLKGESSSQVKELFYALELDKLVDQKFKRKKWYEVSKAIHICSALELVNFQSKIQKCLNSDKAEVRQQAILFFINISTNDPLDFLKSIKKPLTLWEQIYIEEYLRTNYHGAAPNFLEFLHSPLESVQAFAIKMIGVHDQFENVQKILPFLYGSSQNLKSVAVKALAHLDPPQLINFCNLYFDKESPEIQALCLHLLAQNGNHEEVLKLGDRLNNGPAKALPKILKLKNRHCQKDSVFQLSP